MTSCPPYAGDGLDWLLIWLLLPTPPVHRLLLHLLHLHCGCASPSLPPFNPPVDPSGKPVLWLPRFSLSPLSRCRRWIIDSRVPFGRTGRPVVDSLTRFFALPHTPGRAVMPSSSHQTTRTNESREAKKPPHSHCVCRQLPAGHHMRHLASWQSPGIAFFAASALPPLAPVIARFGQGTSSHENNTVVAGEAMSKIPSSEEKETEVVKTIKVPIRMQQQWSTGACLRGRVPMRPQREKKEKGHATKTAYVHRRTGGH